MFGIFKRKPASLQWTNVFGQQVYMEHPEAIKVLKDFENEWPGGLEEVESALKTQRRRADLAESRIAIMQSLGWDGIINVPENERVIISDGSEMAMAWKDRIDGHFYYAPKGGVVEWVPTIFHPVPEL